MPDRNKSDSIGDWLAAVRARFAKVAPDLLHLVDIYSAEARFGRQFIARDLESLSSGARILEVGAGSCLLSCQLEREGFRVSALEPTGFGFSHFGAMRRVILEVAGEWACHPRILDLRAERLAETDRFEYAFSVNVMEHVGDVSLVLARVGASLTAGGQYHFTCPNYLFPYEPHFNIPTLFSKSLTEKLLGKLILGNRRVEDPEGTWKSLNWINVVRVAKSVSQHQWLTVDFDRSLIVSTLERAVTDPGFGARRSAAVRGLLGWLVGLGAHRFFRYVPASLQPIMDCRVRRIVDPKERL